jgi:hypothetical protein
MTVSSQGALSLSLQVSQMDVWLTAARVTAAQISTGSRGEPSIPGSGSCRITSSASSFTSVAERRPSSCGILNTFTQPDIFLMRATF